MATAHRLRRWVTRAFLALPILATPSGLPAQGVPERDSLSQSSPPVAKVVPQLDTVAGVPGPDPYAWLRDNQRQRPEVLDYLRSENKYTEAMTRRTGTLQELLFKEMVGHIKETDASVPERIGQYYYYTRTIKGQQYPVFCRKRGSLTAAEEILLDENLLAKGHGYSRVALRQVSPDGNLLAYTHDTTGSEWYTIRVKDLRSGKILPDQIDSVSYGLEWAADNRTLFFTRDNPAHRPSHIFRRALGGTDETLVVSEPDSLYFLALGKTKDRTYLIAQSSSFTTGEVRYVSAKQPTAQWQVLIPRKEGVEYDAEHYGGDFLVRTNDGAVNFKVMRMPGASPDRAHWTELVPPSDS